MTETYIDPSPANFQAFKDLPRDEPIHMLNLLRYREQAEYPEGHEHAGKGWSGRRAYEEYGKTRPARARKIDPPPVWERDPPVRYRKSVPDSWIALEITEGKNRQVRRMTAAVGLPTLRLVRWRIGDWSVDGLAPGEWRELAV